MSVKKLVKLRIFCKICCTEPYHDGCLLSYKFLVHLYAALRSEKDESKFSSLCQNLKICFNISKWRGNRPSFWLYCNKYTNLNDAHYIRYASLWNLYKKCIPYLSGIFLKLCSNKKKSHYGFKAYPCPNILIPLAKWTINASIL